MLVILPFEEEFYRRNGVRVEFVGHPLLEDFAPDTDRDAFLRRLHLDPARQTVALLPGSRRKEVDYILPTLLVASLQVRKQTQSAVRHLRRAPRSARRRNVQGRCVSRILKNSLLENSFRISCRWLP